MRDLTIFVEKYNDQGDLEGIYIKEKINENENKIIIANKGQLVKDVTGFNFKLFQGKVITINPNSNYSFGFEETNYNLSKFSSKTRKYIKLDETNTLYLINCLKENIVNRNNIKERCDKENSYLIKETYEEIFKRVINPIYIIILSLISSLIILKPKSNFLNGHNKILLFILGFFIILFSQLSYKFISYSELIEILLIVCQ